MSRPVFIGRFVRFQCVNMRDQLAPRAARFPRALEALGQLEKAIGEEAPPDAGRDRGQYDGRWSQKELHRIHRAKQQECRRLQRKLAAVSAELEALRRGKDRERGNRMTAVFLQKVALSKPSAASARSFDGAWADLVGVGSAGCSRPTVSKICNHFVEVVKEQSMQQVTASAAAFAQDSRSARSGRSSAARLARHLCCVRAY